MDDLGHRVRLDDLFEERLAADVADEQGHRFRQRRAKTRGEVVDDDDCLAGVGQRMHHVAADIAAAACDEDSHAVASRKLSV